MASGACLGVTQSCPKATQRREGVSGKAGQFWGAHRGLTPLALHFFNDTVFLISQHSPTDFSSLIQAGNCTFSNLFQNAE